MWPFRRQTKQLEVKQNPVGTIISAWSVGQPVWTERRYEQLADEAYIKNCVAHKCVKLIAQSAAMTPWLLSDARGNEIEKHPLLDLLSRPAPTIGGHALFEAFYAYLLLSGNSYLIAQRNSGNKPPRELWPLRPDRVKVIPGRQGLPQAYRYEAGGGKLDFPVDPKTGASDVLHLKEFHPTSDWYGLGRTEPAAYGIDRHNAAAAHNKALLDNGARPSGALIYKPIKDASGNEVSAPQEVIEAARKELTETRIGPQNAGIPHVFNGNVEWQEMGITPKDQDWGNGKNDAARDIAESFGVPHILIVTGDATYNNIREAELMLWEHTIEPLLDHSLDALNAWLVPMFGDGLRLGFDKDEISALEPRREAKRKSVMELLTAGVIDANEAREALQYGPREKEAVGKVDAQVLNVLVMAVQNGDGSMVESLYRYLISVGLLEPDETLDDFIADWASGNLSPDIEDAIGEAEGGAKPNGSATPNGAVGQDDNEGAIQ